MNTLTKPRTVTTKDRSDHNSPMPVAADIAVHIPDLSHGVPGSDLSVWAYREQVDADWQPGPDYPGIAAEPLPCRRGNLGELSILTALKRNKFSTDEPIVQALARTESVDMRKWYTTEWSNSDQKQVSLPPEKHYPSGGVPGGLFLNTVHNCFDRHFPLGIRPEALMWMILHEVGVTVRQNPDDYRDFFTASAENEHIEVCNDDLRLDRFDQSMEWATGIGDMYEELRERIPSDIIEDMMPTISTHDFDSQVASMVAVLDAASPYYSYGMGTMCGIPRIRLFGESQDYDSVVASATMLSEKFAGHLSQYFQYLLPVLKEIADTATGRKQPDNDFWSSIYKHYSGSGTDDMDGWITAFMNYINVGDGYQPKSSNMYDWAANLELNDGRSFGRGIKRSHLPQHLSMVPFEWTYAVDPAAMTKFDCRLVGGFLGVDDVAGFATPALSYAVLRGDQVTT